MAPLNLAENCIDLIAREAEHARHGRPARIIAKMNALLDKNMIMALVSRIAGRSGDRPDRARHVRACGRAFAGSATTYGAQHCGTFSGAQPHFLFRTMAARRRFTLAAPTGCRVIFTSASKCMFPLKDPMLRDRMRQEILGAYLADNVKARILQKRRIVYSGMAGAGQTQSRPPAQRLQCAGLSDRHWRKGSSTWSPYPSPPHASESQKRGCERNDRTS